MRRRGGRREAKQMLFPQDRCLSLRLQQQRHRKQEEEEEEEMLSVVVGL